MSKDITISEGGVSKSFTGVEKIVTNLSSSGTQNWIPEDEAGSAVDLGTKTVSADGTYYAEDDGYDGYSSFTVNVGEASADLGAKQITANGIYNASDDGLDGYNQVVVALEEKVTGYNTEDGIWYEVTKGDDGNLVFTPIDTSIPYEIRVTTLPTQTRYNPGETIDYSGIVVTAYKVDGTVFTDETYTDGTIPFSELMFPVTTAPT